MMRVPKKAALIQISGHIPYYIMLLVVQSLDRFEIGNTRRLDDSIEYTELKRPANSGNHREGRCYLMLQERKKETSQSFTYFDIW